MGKLKMVLVWVGVIFMSGVIVFAAQQNNSPTARLEVVLDISAGVQSVDIVTSTGMSVLAPNIMMSTIIVGFLPTSSTGMLGTDNERLRVENPTNVPTWTLSLSEAVTGSGWVGVGGYNMRIDTPVGAAEATGELRVNTDNAFVTRILSGGSDPGVTIPTNLSFSGAEAVSIAVADASATVSEGFDIMGIVLEQQIPAAQPADVYTIDMVLTIA